MEGDNLEVYCCDLRHPFLVFYFLAEIRGERRGINMVGYLAETSRRAYVKNTQTITIDAGKSTHPVAVTLQDTRGWLGSRRQLGGLCRHIGYAQVVWMVYSHRVFKLGSSRTYSRLKFRGLCPSIWLCLSTMKPLQHYVNPYSRGE